MSTFSKQNNIAGDLLDKKGVICLHKSTRSGCTISLIMACVLLGLKVVIFAPTVKIIYEIKKTIPQITSTKPRIAPILSNPKLCRKLIPNPKLKFQLKENCSYCEFEGDPEKCVFQALLWEEFDVYCLTYAKLQALQVSPSREAKLLVRKLQKCDVFIFDEFATGVVRNVPTITIVAPESEVKNDENE